MQVISKENVSFFDIDDTLILTRARLPLGVYTQPVSVLDPITHDYIEMVPHEAMIRLLLEEHHRGSYVIVWSRGGYEWATCVLKALNLEAKVNLVMSKPHNYFDDSPIEKWLTQRVYLEPGFVYKK